MRNRKAASWHDRISRKSYYPGVGVDRIDLFDHLPAFGKIEPGGSEFGECLTGQWVVGLSCAITEEFANLLTIALSLLLVLIDVPTLGALLSPLAYGNTPFGERVGARLVLSGLQKPAQQS